MHKQTKTVMYQFLKSVKSDKNYCYFFKNNVLFPSQKNLFGNKNDFFGTDQIFFLKRVLISSQGSIFDLNQIYTILVLAK